MTNDHAETCDCGELCRLMEDLAMQFVLGGSEPGTAGEPGWLATVAASLERIRRVRQMINDLNPTCRLEVDGGVKASNALRIVDAGADTLVAGSAIYAPDRGITEAMEALRSAATTITA